MESLGDILRRATQRPTFEGGEDPPANRTEEGDPACPICGGPGWVTLNVGLEDPRFGQAQPCRCMSITFEEERRQRFLKLSNLGSLERFTFDTLEAPDGTPDARRCFEAVVAAAKSYVEELPFWFVLEGAAATGRTLIAAAIANAAMEKGVRASFMTAPDLLDHLRGAFAPNSDLAYDEMFEELKSVPLLVLDDLGIHSATPWAQEKLYQLLNRRYQDRLPTVITLACEMSDLDEHLRVWLMDSNVSQIHRLAGPDLAPALQQFGNLPQEMLARMTFERFKLQDGPETDGERRKTLEAALDFARSYAENPEGWAVFTGVPGSGKTHLAVAIAGERVKAGYPAYFVMAPDLLDHLRQTYNPDSRVSYDRMFEQVKNTPLLILDDLGAHSVTPWAQEKLYQLLNRRYQDRLPTVITLACEMSDLDEHLRVRLMDSNVSQIHRLADPDLAPALQQFGNLPQEMLARMTFERFKLQDGPETDGERRKTLEAALDFARSYAENPEGWAVFTGVPGSGKTHLAVAIAGERVKAGYPAYFVMAPDLLDHLRQTYNPDSRVSYDRMFEQVKNTPLLILDDLGAHSVTPWAQEKLYQLLNRRYQDRLPTVITLACEMSDLDEHLRVRLMDSNVSQIHRLADPDLAPALQQFGNLPQEMLARMTFERFKLQDGPETDGERRKTLEAALDFARSYAENPEGWAVFTGVPGSGKTHLAVAIAGERVKAGYPAYFVMAPDLLDHLRQTYNPDSRVSYDRMFEQVKNTPLLILDDLGAHSVTPWAQEKLYQLLNRRYQDRLPTVITLACEMSDLDEHLRVRLMDSNVSQIHRLADPDLAPALQQFGNLPQEMLDRMTFERFDLRGSPETDAEGGGTLEAALDFARSYAENPEGWAVFTGVPGSGKTHLAVAIAGERVKAGYPAYFVMAPDLLDHLRQTYSPDSRVSYDRLFEQVKNTPLLVLDHLGTHSATPWAQEKLYQLLNRRYQDRLPTVITLACEMVDIDEHLRVRLTDHEVSQVHLVADPDLAPALQQFGNLPQEMLKRMTFERFDLRGGPETDATGRGTLEAAFKFARSYAENPEGWVVFTGVPGSGKTHLAVAIAGERVKAGYPAYFVMAPDLLDHLRQTYSPDSRVSYDRLFELVKNTPLLVLDHLGTHSATPWAQEKLFQLLNRRYQDRLPTVITLACEMADIDEHLRVRLTDHEVSQVHRLADPDLAPALQQFGSLPQEMLKRMTFERFDLRGGPETDATGRGTLEAAFKFARSYAESPDGWVVFTGVPGSGKTHLAVAIAGERVKAGYPAYFVMAPDLLDHLRQTYSPDSRVSYDRMFEQVKNAPLLILDDLGMEMGTPWAREKLYQIFAHRYNLRLPLVITTSNEKLDDLPPSIASRLRDGSLVEIQTIAATDYRPKGVGRNRSKQAGSDRRPKRPQP